MNTNAKRSTQGNQVTLTATTLMVSIEISERITKLNIRATRRGASFLK